jgi:signal transduction histidine kinase
VKRRTFIALLGGAGTWPLAARAQAVSPAVVGFLSSRSRADSDSAVSAFLLGLNETGYVESHDLTVLYRWADGQYERLPLELSIDRAVPLGLILNEIATNSIKHAFGPDGGGRITVKLTAGVGYGEARLSVADNGRGVKQQNPTGTGLKLIVALARQIGGTVDQESSNQSTTTWLTFPVG